MNLLIEPHYLGSQEYFTLIAKSEKITFEINQHFTKQSYKNRSILLTANGPQTLSIPVRYGSRTPYKEVLIDHDQSWLRVHWGSFCSAYGRAPYFEYFAGEFESIWFAKHKFLVDLNIELVTLCLRLLQIDMLYQVTEGFEKEPNSTFLDMRELINPKLDYTHRTLFKPVDYNQVFGNKFVPNLSIVDLIMNEGSNASTILKKSTRRANEQI
ncbi:MAG: WbqC family protein [Cyclobacteriaceae bacterium]